MSKSDTTARPVATVCCAPLGAGALSEAEAERAAALFKAVADPVRLRLLSMIAAADEACVCDLTVPFDLSQPTISHHLRVLRDAGLVEAERRGTWVYYRARRDRLDAMGALFEPATRGRSRR